MDRKLIDYLPLFLHDYPEIKAIMDGEQPEIEELWGALDDCLNDQFIRFATENGIARWEKILQIVPLMDDTLEERRFRVIAKLNFSLPYTYRRLQEILTTICGAGNFKTMLYHNEFYLIVKLAIGNEKNYNEVVKTLHAILPSNLLINVFMFNTHKVVARLTHGGLAKYKHEEVRTEIL